MGAEPDRALLDKAADVTAMALRGAMGGPDSQPPAYAAQVFNEIWAAMRQAMGDLPERSRAGF